MQPWTPVPSGTSGRPSPTDPKGKIIIPKRPVPLHGMFLHRKRCTRLLRPSGDPHALARPNCGLDDPLHGGGRSWSEIARAFKERQREREREAERERERESERYFGSSLCSGWGFNTWSRSSSAASHSLTFSSLILSSGAGKGSVPARPIYSIILVFLGRVFSFAGGRDTSQHLGFHFSSHIVSKTCVAITSSDTLSRRGSSYVHHACTTRKPTHYQFLVAERIHFTLWGIILPNIKLKVYTFWGL